MTSRSPDGDHAAAIMAPAGTPASWISRRPVDTSNSSRICGVGTATSVPSGENASPPPHAPVPRIVRSVRPVSASRMRTRPKSATATVPAVGRQAPRMRSRASSSPQVHAGARRSRCPRTGPRSAARSSAGGSSSSPRPACPIDRIRRPSGVTATASDWRNPTVRRAVRRGDRPQELAVLDPPDEISAASSAVPATSRVPSGVNARQTIPSAVDPRRPGHPSVPGLDPVQLRPGRAGEVPPDLCGAVDPRSRIAILAGWPSSAIGRECHVP